MSNGLGAAIFLDKWTNYFGITAVLTAIIVMIEAIKKCYSSYLGKLHGLLISNNSGKKSAAMLEALNECFLQISLMQSIMMHFGQMFDIC